MRIRRISSASLPARSSGQARRLLASSLLALGALVLGAGAVAAAEPVDDALSAVTDDTAAEPVVEDLSEAAERGPGAKRAASRSPRHGAGGLAACR